MTAHRLLSSVCLLVCFAHAQPPNPARGWNEYQVIMWSTGTPANYPQWLSRLRDIGATAEENGAGNNADVYVRNTFGFYVENLVPELGFLNNRKPIYDADFAGYTATRDKKYLIRKPSLSDPAFWNTARPRLENLIRPYAAQSPLLYQLRDELSIGSFASPMDYDFDPHALADFRGWLQNTYASLDALNEEWRTQFQSWDEVMPLDTYEIKDRERADLAAGRPENYAQWADHRAFMDLVFAQSLDRLRGYIRAIDSVTPVGIEGTQMPSAWGGFDLWRLSQAVDWVEPYDIAGARAIWRSFLPPGTTVLTTVFGDDFPHIRQRLWWLLLNGDRGAIVWDDDTSRAIQKTQEGMPLTDRGRGLAPIFAELKSAAPKIFGLRHQDDRIAIHYSQASLRAHWMFDSREDGNTWPRRFSSYEATFSRIARVRDSFMRVVEDLGLQYNFVSYEQIENGELINGGYKVLLLPESVAMSQQECDRIKAFVEAGGTVIADNMSATMDEHLRRLPAGQLDELFGIQRTGTGWRSKPAGGTLGSLDVFEPDIQAMSGIAQQSSTGVPVVVENRFGDGRTIYLNLAMHNYGKYRLAPPAGDAIRDLFGGILRDSGITPAVQVIDADTGGPVPCVEVWRYQGDDGNYAAVMRNPEFQAASLKQAGYPDNSAIEQTVHVQVLVNGTVIAEADLDPFSPLILKLPADIG